MLLTCCFRDQKTKKYKKNKYKKHGTILETEECSSRCPPQPSPVLTVHSATLRLKNGQDRKLEKYPPSKEEKRLLKQRSQESLHSRRSTDSLQSSNIIQNKSSIEHHAGDNLSKISRIKCRKESLPSPPATPKNTSKYDRRCSSPQSSILTISNLLESTSKCKINYEQKHGPIYTSTPASAGGTFSSSSNVSKSQASIVTPWLRCPEDVVSGGTERSSGFHDAEVIEEQIRKEEESQSAEVQRNIIDETRREHDLTIQKLKEENELELEKAQETFNSNLQKEIIEHKKLYEDSVLRAKNEANATISKLNKQLVFERAKMVAEQQENSNNLEAEYKMKEERLNDSLKQIEKRDQAWQEERADVLKEVQRLKAEATRMVKILAKEYEEENLNEDKKRSLSQEVYSLQLVIEMRTGEMRNLRDQLTRATQQLEQAEIDKQKLRKATARMEDLEEQLKIKNQFERQLSLEKSQLEMNIRNSEKAAKRMSQNVEELQWRIKNNVELPVDLFQKHPTKNTNSPSFQSFCKPLEKVATNTGTNQNLQSTPLPIIKGESLMKKRSCFAVSPEMLQATSFHPKNIDTCENNGAISSDEVIEYMIEVDSEEDAQFDGESHDEGLGDISSDETTESIAPDMEIVAHNKISNNEIYEKAKQISAKSPDKHNFQHAENIQTPCRPHINEKERRPSRLSFETSL